jgi:hypothetical protein
MSIQLEYAWQESCDAALKHFDETGLHASPDEEVISESHSRPATAT